MKKTIITMNEIPIRQGGPLPDPKIEGLYEDFKRLKPRTSLKLEFDNFDELKKIRNGLSNRRKKYVVPEMRLIIQKKTLYVLKMPYTKEEEQ